MDKPKQLRESINNFTKVIKTGKSLKENKIYPFVSEFSISFYMQEAAGSCVTKERLVEIINDSELNDYGYFTITQTK